jgi:hypothetical protein
LPKFITSKIFVPNWKEVLYYNLYFYLYILFRTYLILHNTNNDTTTYNISKHIVYCFKFGPNP